MLFNGRVKRDGLATKVARGAKYGVIGLGLGVGAVTLGVGYGTYKGVTGVAKGANYGFKMRDPVYRLKSSNLAQIKKSTSLFFCDAEYVPHSGKSQLNDSYHKCNDMFKFNIFGFPQNEQRTPGYNNRLIQYNDNHQVIIHVYKNPEAPNVIRLKGGRGGGPPVLPRQSSVTPIVTKKTLSTRPPNNRRSTQKNTTQPNKFNPIQPNKLPITQPNKTPNQLTNVNPPENKQPLANQTPSTIANSSPQSQRTLIGFLVFNENTFNRTLIVDKEYGMVAGINMCLFFPINNEEPPIRINVKYMNEKFNNCDFEMDPKIPDSVDDRSPKLPNSKAFQTYVDEYNYTEKLQKWITEYLTEIGNNSGLKNLNGKSPGIYEDLQKPFKSINDKLKIKLHGALSLLGISTAITDKYNANKYAKYIIQTVKPMCIKTDAGLLSSKVYYIDYNKIRGEIDKSNNDHLSDTFHFLEIMALSDDYVKALNDAIDNIKTVLDADKDAADKNTDIAKLKNKIENIFDALKIPNNIFTKSSAVETLREHNDVIKTIKDNFPNYSAINTKIQNIDNNDIKDMFYFLQLIVDLDNKNKMLTRIVDEYIQKSKTREEEDKDDVKELRSQVKNILTIINNKLSYGTEGKDWLGASNASRQRLDIIDSKEDFRKVITGWKDLTKKIQDSELAKLTDVFYFLNIMAASDRPISDDATKQGGKKTRRVNYKRQKINRRIRRNPFTKHRMIYSD